MSDYEILELFMKNNPQLVQEMIESDHNYSQTDLNPHHLEGSVWSHTMMVYNQAKPHSLAVKIASLLHDIGKPACREVVEKNGVHKVRYNGHEGMSFYKSIDVLKNTYGNIISRETIRDIAVAIANHTAFFSWKNGSKCDSIRQYAGEAFGHHYRDVVLLLNDLAYCDSTGRISLDGANYNRFAVNGYLDYSKNIKYTKKTLTLLVGPPNAGKSTYIQSVANDSNVNVLSRDDLVMYHSNAWKHGYTYTEAWKNVNHSLVDSELQKNFHEALKNDNEIVIDMTNMSKKARRKWINPARQNGYNVKIVVFFTGYDTIMERNKNREGKFIPENVIHSMMSGFTYPLFDEADIIYEVMS